MVGLMQKLIYQLMLDNVSISDFNAFSDGSVVREGWYIDDVALAERSHKLAKLAKGNR